VQSFTPRMLLLTATSASDWGEDAGVHLNSVSVSLRLSLIKRKLFALMQLLT